MDLPAMGRNNQFAGNWSNYKNANGGKNKNYWPQK